GNPDLKWETTTQTNIGIDAGLFNSKFYVSADYFIKNTHDILLGVSLPKLVGQVDATFINAGEVRNQGFEIALSMRDKTSGGFGYNLSANLGTVKNEVIKLHPNVPALTGPVSRAVVG